MLKSNEIYHYKIHLINKKAYHYYFNTIIILSQNISRAGLAQSYVNNLRTMKEISKKIKPTNAE